MLLTDLLDFGDIVISELLWYTSEVMVDHLLQKDWVGAPRHDNFAQ